MIMRTRLAAPLVLLALPAVADAAAPRTFSELASLLVTYMNAGVGVLILAAIVIYFYGISTNVMKFGSEESKQYVRNYFFWGIIVIFVMVSVWGILEMLQNTLFSDSPVAPNGQPGVSGGSFNAPRFEN